MAVPNLERERDGCCELLFGGANVLETLDMQQQDLRQAVEAQMLCCGALHFACIALHSILILFGKVLVRPCHWWLILCFWLQGSAQGGAQGGI